MNETSLNFSTYISDNICKICLSENGVQPVSYNDKKWFFELVNSTPMEASWQMAGWKLCYICSHHIRKYTQFRSLCQKACEVLNDLQKSELRTKPFDRPRLFNYKQTPPELHQIDNPDNCDVDGTPRLDETRASDDCDVTEPASDGCDVTEAVADEWTPTLAVDPADDGKKENRKKKKKSKKSDGAAGAGATAGAAGGADGGFSARMRREADEYVVIKLTPDQVRSEQAARAGSERVRRAPHRCTPCALPFNFPDVLRAHMRKHDPASGAFRCEFCSQYVRSAVALRGHLKSHTTRYQCKVCGRVRRSRQHLLEHFHTSHAARAPLYQCARCAFASHKRTVMQRHVRVSHAGAGAGAGGGGEGADGLACEVCGRRCRTKEALRVHTARHDKSSWPACARCGRRFVLASLLRAHERSHAARDLYCVECDLSFQSPYNLQLHFKRAKRHREPATSASASAS